MMAARTRRTRKTKRKSTLVRAKTPAKARVGAKPVTMVARERTPARARVAAQRTGPNLPLTIKVPQPQWVGVVNSRPSFSFRKILTCQQILSMDSQTSELG
jgi:hypothetical protein